MTKKFETLIAQKTELEEKISDLVSAFIAETGFVPEISVQPVWQCITIGQTTLVSKVLHHIEVSSKLTTNS